MQTLHRQQIMRKPAHYFIVILCSMVLFLSGCGGLLSDTSSTPNQTIAGTTPTLPSEQPKTDNHGIHTEALTRAQLEKVQHIIAGMTLDQKLRSEERRVGKECRSQW